MLPLVILAQAVVEPPEPDALVRLSGDGMRQPAGCALLEAKVTETNRLGVLATSTVTTSYRAELRDGVWTLLDHGPETWDNEESRVSVTSGGEDLPFLPSFFGRMASTGDQDSLYDDVLQLISTPSELQSVSADTLGGVPAWTLTQVLGQQRTLFRGYKQNTVETTFLRDPLAPRRWVLTMDDPVRVGPSRLSELNMTMYADPDGLPLSEDLHLRWRLGPFVLEVDRSLAWTRTGPCT